MLLAFGNPPTAVHLDIFVIVAHGVQGQFVLAFFFGDKGSDGVAGACGVCFVCEIHYLLSVLVERGLGCTECLVLGNHVLHIVDVHTEVFAEVHLQLDVRCEDFAVVILIVLVRFNGIAVY